MNVSILGASYVKKDGTTTKFFQILNKDTLVKTTLAPRLHPKEEGELRGEKYTYEEMIAWLKENKNWKARLEPKSWIDENGESRPFFIIGDTVSEELFS